MTPSRITELREICESTSPATHMGFCECLDAIEALVQELIAQRENEHAVMGDLLATRDERDKYRAALKCIARDGSGQGMGSGLRISSDALRDVAREAFGEKNSCVDRHSGEKGVKNE